MILIAEEMLIRQIRVGSEMLGNEREIRERLLLNDTIRGSAICESELVELAFTSLYHSELIEKAFFVFIWKG